MYADWIYPYLYYFDVKFDNRTGNNFLQFIDGKSSLMLVPPGAKNPTIFQRRGTIGNVIYTNSLGDFYLQPDK